MIERQLANTGLHVSALGFGCGAIGGLMVRGEYSEMVRTVARAVDAGITYFDTAAIYGDGRSEENLGKVLKELQPDVIVGTKVRLRGADLDDIPAAVARSVEASLQRLQLDHVHLIQLHNSVANQRNESRDWITPEDVGIAAEALQQVVQRGQAVAWGINGLGETDALHRTLRDVECQTIQCAYNLLNPSAVERMPEDFSYQDYERLAAVAAERGASVIAIRTLAGGAMSGEISRHPWAAAEVDPIATNDTYVDDVNKARQYANLVDEGIVESLVEAALRYTAFTPEVTTALVGISSFQQLEDAVAYVERGPLPHSALTKIRRIQGLL